MVPIKKLCVFLFVSKVRDSPILYSPPQSNEAQKTTMASKAARIAAVAHKIFGTVPNRGARTGMQYLKKPLTGAYEARYYMEPIEPIARKVSCDCDVLVVVVVCLFCLHFIACK